MIVRFRHKGLERFFKTGSKAGVVPDHAERLRLILARLNASRCHEDMRLPALRLHRLSGQLSGFWAVDVSGNWRVIFHFEDGQAVDVDYLDYH